MFRAHTKKTRNVNLFKRKMNFLEDSITGPWNFLYFGLNNIYTNNEKRADIAKV